MKKIIVFSLLLAAGIILDSGCASDGSSERRDGQTKANKDGRSWEEKLQVGMSKEEVRKALGEPHGKYAHSTGEESWRYSDTAKAFIPFYAVGGGKFQNLIVNFDSNGKVKDWSSNRQGIY
jgi:outer membrane protein assembly factor BamE (lipoprotein component of BamABCDE complex)